MSGWQWQPQVERLGDYHCLVPDLPGHGESRSVEFLGLDDMTQRVLEAVEHCTGYKRFHIVGNSFGGLVALHLLKVAPERVETVMVSGSAAGLGRALGAVARVSAALYHLPLEPFIKLSYTQFGIPKPYRKLFHDDVLRTADAAFARKLTEAMMAFRLPSSASAPVLAAVGQRETFAAKRAARKIAGLPNGRGVLVPGVSHVWNLQAPDLFAETVRAWTTQTLLPAPLQPLHGRG